MKTINFKGKGEHSVNELELIIEQQAEELHLIKSGQKQLILSGVVSCVCKIPEPRLKVSENGTHAYCNNCAKTYLQK